MRIVIALLFILALSLQASAATISVPQDQPTIQAAINAAVDGDTVLVGPGVWVENINLLSKNLCLKSEFGREQTTIQAANSGANIVTISGGQNATSIIEGFKITGTTNGWGIYVDQADPQILSCEVSYCIKNGDGGGIHVRLSGGTIRDCLLHHNECSTTGGAIVVASTASSKRFRIEENVIYSNRASSGPGIGCTGVARVDIIRNLIYENIGTADLTGGIYVNGNDCKITNNTVVDNTKGITLLDGSNIDVRNNIVAYNHSTGMLLGAATSAYNDVWSNGSGNTPGTNGISQDPMFVDTVADNFVLQATSPCIDAGDPNPIFNDPDGSRNDLGALSGGPQEYPLAVRINYGQGNFENVVHSFTPTIYWTYVDTSTSVQAGYEIEIGSDTNWVAAEMWQPGTQMSPDTSAVYIGSPLLDHHSYYLRLRVSNGTMWGEWSYSSFLIRMSQIIHVPEDQATIQAGINAAVDGDTVLVGPGLYTENIDFGYKNIALQSELGREQTTIQAAITNANVVTITGGQDATSVVEGFKITGTTNGWGIYVYQADPQILSCEVSYCIKNGDGGGMYFVSSGAVVRDCLIHHNHASTTGGGIAVAGTSGKRFSIERNVIYSNSASSGPGIGCPGVTNIDINRNLIYENTGTAELTGGLYVAGTGCTVINNTIVGNTKGITLLDGNNIIIRNNIVAYNQSAGMSLGAATSAYNDVWSNGSGNDPGLNGIISDPLFVNLANDDYSLSSNSPCINAGDPDPTYNDPDGSRNDMGAFPFISPDTRKEVPQEYPTIQSAIDVATDGDTVLVDDGHYYERVSFLGKKIIVASKYLMDSDTLHIYQTIIDGDTAFVPLVGDTGSVVRFVNNEDSTSILEGFTVQNGVGINGEGGGVYCENSGPKLLSNRITSNGSNCALRLRSLPEPGAILESCWVFGNLGSGVRCMYNGLYQSRHSSIVGNSGDGILCKTGAVMSVIGGTISLNGGDGVGLSYGNYRIIRDCLIESNVGSGIGTGTSQLTSPVSTAATSQMESEVPGYRYLVNCVVRGNSKGAVFTNDAVWTVDSCLFEGNQNGGFSLLADVHLVLRNCIVRGNGNVGVVGGGIRFASDQIGGVECYGSIFEGNIANQGGAIAATKNCPYSVSSCTFVGNYANQGSAIFQGGCVRQNMLVDNCVFAFNRGESVIARQPSPDPENPNCPDSAFFAFSCTNIFGNEGGDWVDFLNDDFNGNNNLSANPLFCDTASGDYRIKDSSPCAPANNSCGVMIGAYGIGCANASPVLTSGDSAQTVSGLGFVYKAASTDIDGPAIAYSFINLPSWLTANGDSAFGTPPLTDIDTSFVVIVSDGFLADSQAVAVEITESPIISELTTEGVAIALNVISHTPTFSWEYFDATDSFPQTQFEIAVGSDSDWTYSELWNPAPFNGAATSRQYAGAALLDGQTYWMRARVRNTLIWSNWKQTSFHMNSIPTAPVQLSPLPGSNIASAQPTFVVRNSFDAEVDSLYYTFEVSLDTAMSAAHSFTKQQDLDSLTSAAIDVILNENTRYFWRVRASDYYEESPWSSVHSFWVNTANSAPAAFALTSPADAFSPPIATRTPMLGWTESVDFDPLDAVSYTLHLALDSNFAFVSVVPGISSNQYTPPSPLTWGTRYWWKVRALDLNGGETWSSQVFRFRTMALGDADGSGVVTVSDVVFLINYIFSGGPAPNPLSSGDADCSGAISISDAVYLIQYIFSGGPMPCER